MKHGVHGTTTSVAADTWGNFLLTRFTLVLTWISNHVPSKVWDDIIYPFPIPNYLFINCIMMIES